MGTLVTNNIFGLGNTNPIKGSLFFNGGIDSLGIPSIALGSGDWTIEFWFYMTKTSSTSQNLYDGRGTGSASSAYPIIQILTTESLLFWTTGGNRIVGSTTIQVGSWNHVALVKNSGTTTLYLNGVSEGTYSDSNTYLAPSNGIGRIGTDDDGNELQFYGYFSNYRIVKGTAVYTANFTPPTEELTVVENTVLLCCQDSNNPLQEATGKTLTPYGRLMVPVDKPELVTNGDFSNDLIGWDDVSVGTGYARYDTSRKAAQVHRVDGSNSGRIAQGMGLEAGKVYDVRVRCHSDSNTGLQFKGYKSSDSSTSSTTYSRVLATYGTTVFHFRYTGESGYDGLWFLPIDNTSTNSYITNISVKEYDPRPGDNLILNGNGDSGKTNEWTDANTSTFDINSGRFRVIRSGGTGNCSYQALATVVGQEYTIRADIAKGSGSYGDIRVYTDSGYGTMLAYIRSNASTSGLRETTFIATTTTTHIVFVIDSDGETSHYDNIVVTPTHNYNSPKNVPTVGALADDGVVFVGDTKFDTKRYMVPPTGTTEQRGRGRGMFISAVSSGNWSNAISYIQIQTLGEVKDFGDLIYPRRHSAGTSSATRGVIGAGIGPSWPANKTTEYSTLATTGNALSFGELSDERYGHSAVANSTRVVWGGGYAPSPVGNNVNTIEYVTTASTGDSTDFGDLSDGSSWLRRYIGQGVSDGTRGVLAGGYSGSSWSNDIIYIPNLASLSDSSNFGSLSGYRGGVSGCSDSTRGVFMGGYYPANLNTIDYVTIPTTGDALDFGDLTTTSAYSAAVSNGIRGVTTVPGGANNTMNHVTIQTTGNAQDFGDLNTPGGTYGANSTYSDSHGGLS